MLHFDLYYFFINIILIVPPFWVFSPKLPDVANAFAVLSVKVRSTLSSQPDRRDKLSFSVPQVYQDLPGEIKVWMVLLQTI